MTTKKAKARTTTKTEADPLRGMTTKKAKARTTAKTEADPLRG